MTLFHGNIVRKRKSSLIVSFSSEVMYVPAMIPCPSTAGASDRNELDNTAFLLERASLFRN
jgi:hypothetical protein